MKTPIACLLFATSLLVVAPLAIPQSPPDHAVQLSVTAQKTPPRITLNWAADAAATSIQVSRRLASGSTWGTPVSVANPSTATSYADNSVSVGQVYEYKVVKSRASGPAYGYTLSAIERAAIHSRGVVLLIVENSYLADSTFATKLAELDRDLIGDGWQVRRRDVSRNDSQERIRALIKADYLSDTGNVKAVFLLGHVPVPYSGVIAPDGHPDHFGAWPADGVYGDVNGNWRDLLRNYPVTQGGIPNIPGDGKFDADFVASNLELMVGRVDLNDMPGFAPLTEKDLLIRYLAKSHGFKQKQSTAGSRALIMDGFGDFFGEAFAATAWASFPPLVGAANIQAQPWFPILETQTYLWAYGCGAGFWGSSCSVVCTAPGETSWCPGCDPGWCATGCDSANFATKNVRAMFTILFGSYFGDWNHSNNLLRAPLASATNGLSCLWGGRPQLYLHHMGLGEPIGESTRRSQNNGTDPNGDYVLTSFGNDNRGVQVALMGDPTLRQNAVAPASNLNITRPNASSPVTVTWTASPDSIAGYNVYRSAGPRGPFALVNTSGLVTGTSYVAPASSQNFYMVRAIKLETTQSGTYFNSSEGIFRNFTGVVAPAILVQPANQTVTVTANPAPPASQMVSAIRTVAFVVDAYGTDSAGVPNLTYQWRKNGVDIAGATASSFVLNTIQSSDAATYTCRVSNPSGSLTSSGAVLTVNQVPVALNDTLSFNEGASGQINVLQNDTDANSLTVAGVHLPNLPPLVQQLYSPPEAFPFIGIQVVNPATGLLQVTPSPGFYGQIDIPYVVSDGWADVEANLHITVNKTSLADDLTQFGLTGGSTFIDNGSSRVLADGRWEILGGTDTGHVEYETRSGDFDLVTRVHALYNSMFYGEDAPSVGVFLRTDLVEQHPFASIGVDSGFFVQQFRTVDGPAFSFTASSTPAFAFPNAWVRLERRGQRIVTYGSTDGVSWVQIGPVAIIPNLPQTLLVGLYASYSTYTVVSDYQVRPALGTGTFGANVFQFQIMGGPASGSALVEASSTLQSGSWVSLGNATFVNGIANVQETLSSNPTYPYTRFYRATVGSIHSANGYGFVQVQKPNGISLWSNPLNRGGNTVTEIFGSTMLSGPISVSKPNGGGGNDVMAYDPDGGWGGTMFTLGPGEAAWLDNATGSPLLHRMVGQLAQGSLINPIPSGFSYRSSMVPQTGLLQTQLGFPVNDENLNIYFYNSANGQWIGWFFDPDSGWSPGQPSLLAGEAVQIDNPNPAKNWVRSFSIWAP